MSDDRGAAINHKTPEKHITNEARSAMGRAPEENDLGFEDGSRIEEEF